MDDKQIASRVLDYWFAVEFLAQDSYDMCTDGRNIERKMKNFLNSSHSKRENWKEIFFFTDLTSGDSVYDVIKNQAETFGMSTWGNLTFFIGKVKRQTCIESLAQQLGVSLEQAEKNSDEIPVLSFQCTCKGDYVPQSLSLSTIVWALSQIQDHGSTQISELLSESRYRKTLKKLEEKYFKAAPAEKKSNPKESSSLNKDSVQNENPNQDKDSAPDITAQMPVFEPDSVSTKRLTEIAADLNTAYKDYIGAEIEAHYAVKCQYFKNDAAKTKLDDNNYMGLSHDFFSSDLKMVKTCLEDGTVDFNSGMLPDLLSYICAPYRGLAEKTKHDLAAPEDIKTFQSELSEILNMKNAPIAKWPSRYMPALMQQVAINFAISNKTRGIFGENGHIFSVNGPPGTGKTTLLKEIIANNVVEKAKLLCKYKNPDNAFDFVYFKKGKYNGAYEPFKSNSRKAKDNSSNASPWPYWGKFKNEQIADYGVLVTSCNNAAVENITKELPLSSGILDNLKPVTSGEKPDSAEMQQQLGEIRKLFSPEETDIKLTIFKNDKEDNTDKKDNLVYPEIYFTGYAKKFLGTDEKDADAWGLIAAPLGKKSNIYRFFRNVMHPVWEDFLKANKSLEANLPKYHESQTNFRAQLKKVQALQNQLAKYGDVTLAAHKAVIKRDETERLNTNSIAEAKKQQTAISRDIVFAQNQLGPKSSAAKEANALCLEIDQKIAAYKRTIDNLSDQEIDCKEKAAVAENSVSFLTRFFRRSKYETALDLARSYRKRAESYAREIERWNAELALEMKKGSNALDARNDTYKKLDAAINHINKMKTQWAKLQETVQTLRAEIASVKKEADISIQTKDALLEEYRKSGPLKSGQVLDGQFISRTLSEDADISTEAQTVNPWATEEYNREREKLFYLALQMTKYFVLSSKACRANLHLLAQCWGFDTFVNNELIIFDPEEKEQMIGSLFNTLFLLTPVISSTFASVGRLLKDIKEPGVIGTLIIDEAGQAQPQMAVGALFRARRSIIVGDPRQVEPVVTDDLKLLKDAYSDPLYAYYKNKSLSVQTLADIINPFGTYLENETGTQDWVGCPLLIHRRCISPMYEISNSISYNGIMKQKTLPPSAKKRDSFIFEKSQWINIGGTENGKGDHYVEKQGKEVCEMVSKAFEKSCDTHFTPDLYIISPFNSVVKGVRKSIEHYARIHHDLPIGKSEILSDWLISNIGTVHKFQGKEANEVIFLLGCDSTVKKGFAVTGFVNSNIVNVAATRAKYRLYIVGNIDVWRSNRFVNKAKNIIDTLPLKTITELERAADSEEKNHELAEQLSQLPGSSSFVLQHEKPADEESEYYIDADEFISSINKENFLNKDLSEHQYREFGFASKSEFESLPADVKKNLLLGMKLYYLLQPVYSAAPTLDASCCGILFCKAMELYLKQNFVAGLKTRFPDYSIKSASRNLIKLEKAADKDFMIGTIQYILKNKLAEIGSYMSMQGETALAAPWWGSFSEKLRSFAGKRNECCHPQRFGWQDMQQLLEYEFREDAPSVTRDPKIGGVFFESENGRKLG